MLSNSIFSKQHESEWISISDLMSGLMMIFLFIAISYMNILQIKAEQIKKIAVAYQELQNDLYDDLFQEFKNDLDEWKAEIDRETLSVKFHEPEVLFNIGSSEVTERFHDILKDFFPRYIKIIFSEKYRDHIEEIRIEGHTSSEWSKNMDEETAYFLNMKLSQDRTRSVLKDCMSLIANGKMKTWARRFLTANGLSSSRHIIHGNGLEDYHRSRRVEFRTKTAAEKKVVEIINRIEANQ